MASTGRRTATAARVAAMTLVLCGMTATASAQTPLQFKTEDGATTLKVGTLVQGLVVRDTGGLQPVNDMYLRRIRLVAGGQIQKRLKYFIESDTPYLGRKGGTWQMPPTIVQDAFMTYDVRPGLQVDAGLMLVPNSYNSTQSAASLLPIGYGPYSFLSSAPTYARVGRDQGVQLRGYGANGHVEYRLGVFRGLSRVNDSAQPRYAGRVVWYPFKSQTGFFYAGTLQGTKKMVAVGASIDHENAYNAYGADVFVEWPVGKSVVTAQGGLLRFDGGHTFTQLPLQNTWLAEAGFSVPGKRVGVFAQAARQDLRAITAPDATSLLAGVTVWLRPSIMNVKVGAGRTMKDRAASHTQVSVQLQLWVF